jgi:hypothetical protein
MADQDHPSSYRASPAEALVAAAARQVVETRDRSMVIKCTRCALTFIGSAVPPVESVTSAWVCPVCLDIDQAPDPG